ncbi:hypothetical protein IV102_29615, partial [bacterium]|nr:hypothetical protein [bacterium]
MIHLVTVGTSLNTSKDEFLVQLLREALSSSRWDPVVQRLIDLQGAVCVSRRQEGTDPLPQELSYLHLCPPKPNADPNRVRPIVLGAQAGKKGGFASDLERSGPVLR